MSTVLLVLSYSASVVSAVALGAAVVRSPRRTPARLAVMVFLSGVVAWSALAVTAVVTAPPNPAALVAWTMPAAAVVVAAVRGLVRGLTEPAWRPRARGAVALLAHPIAVAAIAAVPAWHDSVVWVDAAGEASYGLVFWAHVAVSYVLLSRPFLGLVAARAQVPVLAQRPLFALLLAWTIPMVGNVVSTTWVGPRGPDLTPFAFVVTAIVLWRAVVRDGIADIVPVARTQVFEHLADAVFVIDVEDRLLDLNARARALSELGGATDWVLGAPIEEAVPALSGWMAHPGEHDIDRDGAALVVEVTVSDVATKSGAVVARVVHARDVTEAALRRRELARTHRALEDEAKVNERLRAELADQVMRDSGTGLHNRRHVMEQLPRLQWRCETTKEPLSVIALDVDHFKQINDTHGHSAGDRVLLAVAKAMERLVPQGAAARFGGEEFIVLLPGVSADDAFALAERLREACGASSVRARGGPIAVTLSAGVATATPPGLDAHALVDAADRALYRAKEAGRNTTRRADDEAI